MMMEREKEKERPSKEQKITTKDTEELRCIAL
jgi:hypothetical protein